MSDSIIDHQLAYYRARAPEYDEWWQRVGRYDRGEANGRFHADVIEIESALKKFGPTGDVLELACGTGWWTERLAASADSLTAVDASPEAISICRKRCGDGADYVVANLFDWRPSRRFDVVFFSFWLSHVPQDRFDAFWEMVSAALRPAGRAFFVDSLLSPNSSAKDHAEPDANAAMQRRQLNDGREFEVVKIFYDPKSLESRLRQLGWSADVLATSEFFLYGNCSPLPT
jgi:demethylmenaquinone methyltransferase/2-methoxy-6-polyprenyl-1,4-benzoquinol methylase